MTKLTFAHCTDTGRVRTHNEDSVVVDAALGLVLVADGMGGHNAGEVASRMATDVIHSCIAAHVAEHGLAILAAATVRQALLRRAVSLANRQIFDAAGKDPACNGMGTTIVLGLFSDDQLTIAHVGDSRAYRLREGVFEQLTRDHSSVQQKINAGTLNGNPEREFERRRNLTRAIGVMPQVELEMREELVAAGDKYLVCSDGLSDQLDFSVLRNNLANQNDEIDLLCTKMVAQANDLGGEDNLSVILVRADKISSTLHIKLRRVLENSSAWIAGARNYMSQ